MWHECVIKGGKEMGLEKVRDVKHKRRDRRQCMCLTHAFHQCQVSKCHLCLLFSVSGNAHRHGVDVAPSSGKVVVCCCHDYSLSSFWSLWQFYFWAMHMSVWSMWWHGCFFSELLIKMKVTKKPHHQKNFTKVAYTDI